MSVLEVKNLKVLYSNHVAIENISFEVNEGEYVCLMGENGSREKYINKNNSRTN